MRPASWVLIYLHFIITGASHWRKTLLQLLIKIDDNLKRQIKNRTLYTCRLFLITRIFKYIGCWSKVFGHLPTLFLQYTQSNAGLYINWVNTSLF